MVLEGGSTDKGGVAVCRPAYELRGHLDQLGGRYYQKELVAESRLAVIVSMRNGLSPVLVDLAKETYIIDSMGISKQPGHVHQRTLCMQKFVELYGMTLKSSDTAVVRSPIDGKQIRPLAEAFRATGRPWGKNKSFEHKYIE